MSDRRRTELPFVPVAARPADAALADEISDLEWADDGRLAIAAGGPALALWRPGTAAIERVDSGVRYAGCNIFRLFRHPDGLLAHVQWYGGGSVRRFDGEAGSLAREHAPIGYSATLTIDARGRMLAMPDMHGEHSALVLGRDGRVQLALALDGYRAIHGGGLWIDGTRRLYFLGDCASGRTSPRTLYAIDDDDGAVSRIGPWCEAITQALAVAIDEDAALYRIVVSHDSSAPPRTIERYDLDGGEVVWSRPLRDLTGAEGTFEVTAIAWWPAAGVILVGLANGMLYGVEPESGAIVHRDTPMGGAAVSAIAVFEETVALGTRTGALAVFASR